MDKSKLKDMRAEEKRTKAAEKVENKDYSVEEATKLLSEVSISNFTGSADLDVILRLKSTQKNESIRGSITFPNRFGQETRVLVFAEGADVDTAKDAGADYAGSDELVKKIEDGWLEFDIAVAKPEMMSTVARLGKVLGPRQLMPSPKTGTVTENIEKAVKMYKAGKTDFKMDDGETIKLSFGNLDMEPEQLAENLETALDNIRSETRRLGLNTIKKILVKPTMGPSISIKNEQVI
jgi:large subunit ribosomal protein L1